MRNLRFLLLVCLTALIASCSETLPPEAYLGLNPTLSSSKVYYSPDSDLTIRRFLFVNRESPLQVHTATSFPLEYLYPSCRGLTPDEIRNDLYTARCEQMRGEAGDDRLASIGIDDPLASGYVWRFGSDHSELIARIQEQRDPGRRAVVLLVTDGENEGYEFDDVGPALSRLLNDGNVRIFVVGVSQAVVSEEERRTVLDQWRDALIQTGAPELQPGPPQSGGWYVSPHLILPTELLALPWAELKDDVGGVDIGEKTEEGGSI